MIFTGSLSSCLTNRRIVRSLIRLCSIGVWLGSRCYNNMLHEFEMVAVYKVIVIAIVLLSLW